MMKRLFGSCAVRCGTMAISLGVSLLLGGCATSGGAPLSTASVAPYRSTLALQGSIGINYLRDGKRESLTFGFDWQQSPDATDVTLTLPTRQTAAVLRLTPQLATLQQAGQPVRTAADLDSLTNQILGWTLPVSGLRDWLQGYATDAQGQRFSASPANNTVVTRDGWKVDYLTWQDELAPVPQPKRIELTRLVAGDVEELSIRIAIRPVAEE